MGQLPSSAWIQDYVCFCNCRKTSTWILTCATQSHPTSHYTLVYLLYFSLSMLSTTSLIFFSFKVNYIWKIFVINRNSLLQHSEVGRFPFRYVWHCASNVPLSTSFESCCHTSYSCCCNYQTDSTTVWVFKVFPLVEAVRLWSCLWISLQRVGCPKREPNYLWSVFTVIVHTCSGLLHYRQYILFLFAVFVCLFQCFLEIYPMHIFQWSGFRSHLWIHANKTPWHHEFCQEQLGIHLDRLKEKLQ